MNWTWSYFATEAEAIAFERDMLAKGYETRGVYPPRDRDNENNGKWGVRYR